jgi:hypothetical protein
MFRFFQEWNFPSWPRLFSNGLKISLHICACIAGFSIAEFLMNITAPSKYQQAKMEARTFQSTVCRIEDIIIKETRPDERKTKKTTSIQGFFLLKVINSTNKQDQFKLEEVPLLLQSGQNSLVSKTNMKSFLWIDD